MSAALASRISGQSPASGGLKTAGAESRRYRTLSSIVSSPNWAARLSRRWHVDASTIYYWLSRKRLGLEADRIAPHRLRLRLPSVWKFEETHAVCLGLVPNYSRAELCRRYDIHVSSLKDWRRQHQFPRPYRLPTTNIQRWEAEEVHRWEKLKNITPASLLKP